MMELWFNLVLTPPRLAQSLALLHRCPERGLGHLGEILSHLIWAQYTNLQLLTQQSYWCCEPPAAALHNKSSRKSGWMEAAWGLLQKQIKYY